MRVAGIALAMPLAAIALTLSGVFASSFVSQGSSSQTPAISRPAAPDLPPALNQPERQLVPRRRDDDDDGRFTRPERQPLTDGSGYERYDR